LESLDDVTVPAARLREKLEVIPRLAEAPACCWRPRTSATPGF